MPRCIFNLPWKVGHILFFVLQMTFFEELTFTQHPDAKMALVPGSVLFTLCQTRPRDRPVCTALLFCPLFAHWTICVSHWGRNHPPCPEVWVCAFCIPTSILLTFLPLPIIPYIHIRSKQTKLPFLYINMVNTGACKRSGLTLVCEYVYVLYNVSACVRVCEAEALCMLSFN